MHIWVKHKTYLKLDRALFKWELDFKSKSRFSFKIRRQIHEFFQAHVVDKQRRGKHYPKIMSKTFHGDIIITDPCYIIKDESKQENTSDGSPEPEYSQYVKAPFENDKLREEQWEEFAKIHREWERKNGIDDWHRCDCGSGMEVLGIKNYLCRDTLYGDWSCTVFDKKHKSVLGNFCADAGMVAVFALDEVLAYNPDYDDHMKKLWTTTWIKGFDGEVSLIEKPYISWHGYKRWWPIIEREVIVVGNGNVNFIGRQTGL